MDEIKHIDCPICRFPNIIKKIENFDKQSYRIECKRCGVFIISKRCLPEFSIQEVKDIIETNSAKFSGLARLVWETNKTPIIFSPKNIIENLLNDPLIPSDEDINKKADLLLAGIKRKNGIFGNPVTLNFQESYSLAFAKNIPELIALLEFLEQSNYLNIIYKRSDDCIVKITAQGWNILQDKGYHLKLKQAFIAIKAEGTEKYVDAIREAIRDVGYNPMCIMKEIFPERIMDKAISEIKRSKFIIVDLTDQRPAVLYEAGFAHALGLDVIFICNKEQKDMPLEFYSKHYQISYYENEKDLKEILVDIIRARIKS